MRLPDEEAPLGLDAEEDNNTEYDTEKTTVENLVDPDKITDTETQDWDRATTASEPSFTLEVEKGISPDPDKDNTQ